MVLQKELEEMLTIMETEASHPKSAAYHNYAATFPTYQKKKKKRKDSTLFIYRVAYHN